MLTSLRLFRVDLSFLLVLKLFFVLQRRSSRRSLRLGVLHLVRLSDRRLLRSFLFKLEIFVVSFLFGELCSCLLLCLSAAVLSPDVIVRIDRHCQYSDLVPLLLGSSAVVVLAHWSVWLSLVKVKGFESGFFSFGKFEEYTNVRNFIAQRKIGFYPY